jgi:PII-like signaling protein
MLEISIFLDEDDLQEGKRMHEYILRYLMHHDIMGATIFRAFGGYGHKHHLNYPGRIGATDEGPIMIMFIDEEQKARAVIGHIREVVKGGLIVAKKVERL